MGMSTLINGIEPEASEKPVEPLLREYLENILLPPVSPFLGRFVASAGHFSSPSRTSEICTDERAQFACFTCTVLGTDAQNLRDSYPSLLPFPGGVNPWARYQSSDLCLNQTDASFSVGILVNV
jgi:hypothetical protein